MPILYELDFIFESKLLGLPLWPATVVGLGAIFLTLGRFFFNLFRNVFIRLFPFGNFRALGEWAVVTGGSDGIGQVEYSCLISLLFNTIVGICRRNGQKGSECNAYQSY